MNDPVLWIGITLVACALGIPRSRDGNPDQADLAAIDKLHETDMAAAKVNDIAILLGLFTDDGILFNPGEEPVRGKAALRAYLQGRLPESDKYVITEYAQRFEEVRIAGE
jgi:ketosteroid isomerase-like protein